MAHPPSPSTEALIETALAQAELDDELPEGVARAIAVLHARGTRDVLEAALTLCASLDPKRRALGAEILGQLGSPRAFAEECSERLGELLRQDRDREVLIKTLFALGHLGSRGREADIVHYASHPDQIVRHGVAFALCGSSEPGAVEVLLKLMDDPFELTRDWATTSIGQTLALDGAAIRGALLRRVTDSDEIVRAEALHGLARRGDARALPCLIAELSLDRELNYLFADAAKTLLGLDEELDLATVALLAALRSKQESP
jgi:HEAT repeat protein